MSSIADNVALIEACGYEVIEHFVQPESAWWEPYYHPLEQRLGLLRKRYAADAEKLALMESIQKEIDVYRRYSAFYSNVSYVMQRR